MSFDRETRATRGVELRAKTDPSAPDVLDGYASVANVWYDVAGGPDKGGWRERVMPGAFTKTLAEQTDAMFLLFDHDGLPIAGTRNGSLVLAEDTHGLRVEATLSATSGHARDVAGSVGDGLIDSMSFAFAVSGDRQEWNEDYTERSLLEVRLFEVSLVKWPANPATVAQLRSAVAALRETRAPRPLTMSLALAKVYAAQFDAA